MDEEWPARLPATLPLLMMLPARWRIMIGAACFMPARTPPKRTAIARSAASSGIVSIPPRGAGPPALLKRQSSRPYLPTVKSMTALTSASRATSVRTKSTRGARARTSA
jgi:hypothetical protein